MRLVCERMMDIELVEKNLSIILNVLWKFLKKLCCMFSAKISNQRYVLQYALWPFLQDWSSSKRRLFATTSLWTFPGKIFAFLKRCLHNFQPRPFHILTKCPQPKHNLIFVLCMYLVCRNAYFHHLLRWLDPTLNHKVKITISQTSFCINPVKIGKTLHSVSEYWTQELINTLN